MNGIARDNPPKTMTVPEAGRQYFGLGRNASYEAAKRGEIPVIRIGSRLRVPVSALEKMLERAASEPRPALRGGRGPPNI